MHEQENRSKKEDDVKPIRIRVRLLLCAWLRTLLLS